MKVSEIVKNKIDRFALGYVFTYSDFGIDVKNESALKVALCRLVKSGKIIRLSKGRFYKPEPGLFGKLNPVESEIVKDLLFDNGKPIGYITGYTIFNKLNFTTQVPNIIQIATNIDKKAIKRGIYKIRFVRQWNKITKENIPLFQLLDCIRFIKKIPDTDIESSYIKLKTFLNDLSDNEKIRVVELAIKYPASSKALLGAILDDLGYNVISEKLYNSLKSTSTYNFNISEDLCPYQNKWRIK